MVGGEPARGRAGAAPATAEEAGGESATASAVPASAPTGERLAVPGSPFTVHVSEGNASATGSFVKEAEAKQSGGDKGDKDKAQGAGGFVAGEHIVIKPQVSTPSGIDGHRGRRRSLCPFHPLTTSPPHLHVLSLSSAFAPPYSACPLSNRFATNLVTLRLRPLAR